MSAAFHFASFGSPPVSQAWHGSSGIILFLAFLFLLPYCTMCGWAARRCLEATLRVSRALVRTFFPFGAGFVFFLFSFLFSPSFRVRPPRTVFLLGFPRTVRPSRAVSLFLGRLFSAHICSRRAGQHALPQSTVGGRHRPFVSHGSKPAVATESLPDGFVSISPTVSVE